MRRDFRSTLGHAAMVTCFSLLVISGCSKEKDSDDTAASPSLAGGNAGVETTTGNDLSLAGQLAISGLELASTTKGILVFSLVKGQVNGKPVKIEVDENGIFNVPIKRADEAIDALLAQLELPRDSRNWSEMAKTIQEGLGMTDVTQEMLESMPEEQLIEGVKGLALDNKEGGLMTLLVAYEISPDGDKVAEAQSFRFISLPTASSGSLGALPNKDLKGNISLGKITGEGSNVISELQANDALDLGASAIDTLASTGNTLKLVKNVYINDKWNVTPFYAWRGAAKSTVIDQFSNVESSTYKGYGTYIPSARNIDVAHTFEDFCGGKSLTFTAPADIDVIVENTPAQKAISFDNSNPEERSQGDSRVCIAGSSMYLREDVRDGKTSFMLNFGSGGSFQNSPEGLWKLAIDGTEEAWFDLAAANPVNADGKPLVFMPSVKFNKVGSQITSVNVELYFWNGSTYVKVTDVEPMRKLISSVNASMSIDSGSSSTESRVQLTINDDGSITGAFDNSGDQDSPNPPMDAADVTSFAVYYEIGNASFRTEFR